MCVTEHELLIKTLNEFMPKLSYALEFNSIDLLKKQFVKEFSSFYGTRKFTEFFTRALSAAARQWVKVSKAVPLHAMEALGGRGGIVPTHSRPRY
jgi:hypothetical protein